MGHLRYGNYVNCILINSYDISLAYCARPSLPKNLYNGQKPSKQQTGNYGRDQGGDRR